MQDFIHGLLELTAKGTKLRVVDKTEVKTIKSVNQDQHYWPNSDEVLIDHAH